MRSATITRLLYLGYVLLSVSLVLFSITQVDLSLTLSRVGVWQTIQKAFQHIGYYERSVAVSWYVIMVGFWFAGYITLIRCADRKLLLPRHIWKLVFLVTGILIFSYPAFSYDMFNYMFTAKTILLYHKNPYTVTPLQFSGIEPWLSFMRWTHLPSAYTPFWIAMTLIPYLLGFGYFVLILINMKLLVASFYLLCVWAISRILQKTDPEQVSRGMVVFAFNPLIIFESLVSAHNDVAMMALSLVAYLLYLEKKRFLSFVVLSGSIGMKLMTFFLLPLLKIGWKPRWATVLMVLAVGATAIQRELLPWYWVWLVPFVALAPRDTLVILLCGGGALGLLLGYAPYIAFGNYEVPGPVIKMWAMIISLGVAGAWGGLLFLRGQKQRNKQ